MNLIEIAPVFLGAESIYWVAAKPATAQENDESDRPAQVRLI